MSAGAVAAAAAAINAIRAIGVVVKVEPGDFVRVVERQAEPMVVHSQHTFLGTRHEYVVSHKGLAFYTKSRTPLQLPPSAEIVNARSIYIPT